MDKLYKFMKHVVCDPDQGYSKGSKKKSQIIKSLSDKTKEAIIIIFKPSLPGSPHETCSVFKLEQDIHPDFIYHSAVKGFASVVEADKLNYLASHPHILRIEKDYPVCMWKGHHVETKSKHKLKHKLKHKHKIKNRKAQPVEHRNGETPWNILQIHKPFSTGAHLSPIPVDLYILDTGISTSHPDLPGVTVMSRQNFVPTEQDIDDDLQGHSSHIAGIAAATNKTGRGVIGVAPGVQLNSIKVLDKNGDGNMSTCIAGIEWLTQEKMKHPEKPMVANLSLGFDSGTTEYNVLDEAIERAIQVGIVFVIAAGNEGANAKTFSPAHVKKAITVGAYGMNKFGKKELASFSNYGDDVDILAPGVDIFSTWKDASYSTQSGTSQASPHVSGCISLYLFLNPYASPEEVKYFLLESAKKNEISGIKENTPNVSLYLGDDFINKCEEFLMPRPILPVQGSTADFQS
jgi:hypothetical protein